MQNPPTTYQHFDLGLSPHEISALNQITVSDSDSYNNFGEPDVLLSELTDFFKAQGNTPETSRNQAMLVGKVITETIEKFGSETAWITLRTSKPTTEYNIPRWHTDGYYYSPTEQNESQYKAVIPIKGTGTLLNSLSGEDREKLEEINRLPLKESDKRQMASHIVPLENAETTPIGSGTVMVAGSDSATVHSEPPIHSDRIFLSVLPGSREQIKELEQRWKQPTKVMGDFTNNVMAENANSVNHNTTSNQR